MKSLSIKFLTFFVLGFVILTPRVFAATVVGDSITNEEITTSSGNANEAIYYTLLNLGEGIKKGSVTITTSNPNMPINGGVVKGFYYDGPGAEEYTKALIDANPSNVIVIGGANPGTYTVDHIEYQSNFSAGIVYIAEDINPSGTGHLYAYPASPLSIHDDNTEGFLGDIGVAKAGILNIGSGDNGTITVTASIPDTSQIAVAENNSSVIANDPVGGGPNIPLSASDGGGFISIQLATDSNGDFDASQNTAAAVASALSGLIISNGEIFTIQAVASGNGSGVIEPLSSGVSLLGAMGPAPVSTINYETGEMHFTFSSHYNGPVFVNYTNTKKKKGSSGGVASVAKQQFLVNNVSTQIVNNNLPVVAKLSKLLKLNNKSDDIKQLQQLLNKNGFVVSIFGSGSVGQETNYFGPKTLLAVKSFQKSHGLVPDGIVGPITWNMLNQN